jgi:hypothetical protein
LGEPLIHARHVGHDRASADVDEDARRRQAFFSDADLIRGLEPGVALNTVQPVIPRSHSSMLARALADTVSARAFTLGMSMLASKLVTGPIVTEPDSKSTRGAFRSGSVV